MFSAISRWLLVSVLVAMALISSVAAQLGGRIPPGGLPRFPNLAKVGVSEALSHGDSDDTLYSSDNYLKCTSDHHLTPTSTREVSDIVKRLTSALHQVKIRATRRGFHSSAGFVCAGQRGSSKKEFKEEKAPENATESFTVLMHLMNRVVAVDEEQHRLTVEAGMTLLELVDAAESNAMSVPATALSICANLTVGGVVMASAHGSGHGAVGSLSDLVRKIKWINAQGMILESDLETERGATEVRALVGGLGLLGIVTEITLQLQPNSWTIVETRKGLSDANIVADLKTMLERATPHVIVFWRPDFGIYKAVMWTQVRDEDVNSETMPKVYPNGGIAYLTPIDPKLASEWSELMAAWEEDVAEESANADVLNADVCALAEALQDASMFQDADGTLIERGTIPTNHAMVAADCAPKCLYHVQHMGTITEDTEFTIKWSQLADWIADVKRVVKTEIEEVEARLRERYGPGSKIRRCLPPGYFWLRFGQANKNLLSTATGDEDLVYVQWTHLHSAMVPNKLAKHSSVAETLEQLTLCKYKGRPHWGKNHERIFTHPDCKVRDNFPATNIEMLLEMQQQHDPERVFEPALWTGLMEKRGPEYSPLCTAHMWCYCRDDLHCPHSHACRPSASFPEYKICRLVEASGHQEDVAEL